MTPMLEFNAIILWKSDLVLRLALHFVGGPRLLMSLWSTRWHPQATKELSTEARCLSSPFMSSVIWNSYSEYVWDGVILVKCRQNLSENMLLACDASIADSTGWVLSLQYSYIQFFLYYLSTDRGVSFDQWAGWSSWLVTFMRVKCSEKGAACDIITINSNMMFRLSI